MTKPYRLLLETFVEMERGVDEKDRPYFLIKGFKVREVKGELVKGTKVFESEEIHKGTEGNMKNLGSEIFKGIRKMYDND
jgi:hypothetical protein